MDQLNSDIFKEFFSNKTNKIYLTILATLCFVLPINSYFYIEVDMIDVNFLFSSAVFVWIGSFIVLTFSFNNKGIISLIKRVILAFCVAFIFYSSYIQLAIKFSNRLQITNGEQTNYYYKGNLFHIDNGEAKAIWYSGNDENYNVTFVYKDGKKVEYFNGEKQVKNQQ